MAEEEDPPLIKAVRVDDANAVGALLNARADIHVTMPPFSWTPLHEAAGNGSIASCNALLAARAKVDAKASDGETPLHLAAQQGLEAGIRLLIGNNASVNSSNDDGETPLSVAVQHVGGKTNGHIISLLELRADPGICNNDGHDVISQGHHMTNCGDALEALIRKHSVLPVASASSRSDPDEQGSADLKKIIYAACKQGKTDGVRTALDLMRKMLTPEGLAASVQDALVPAAAGGSVEIMELLISAGANLHARCGDGASTPLLSAADGPATKVVRWLLDQKVDANVPSDDGATPLMAASLGGHSEIASLLLDANAETNSHANLGWTALMAACQEGRTEVTKQLLDAKAQPEITGADGKTARDLASSNGHGELVKMLDTRVKLDARRAKAAAKSGNQNASVTGNSQMDARDLDALVSELGESQSKSESAKTKKKAVALAAQSHDVANDSEKVAAKALPKKKQARGKTGTNDATCIQASSHSSVIDEIPNEGAADTVSQPEKTKLHGKAEHTAKPSAQQTATCNNAEGAVSDQDHSKMLALRARLQQLQQTRAEIELQRAQIEVEDAKIRQELEQLYDKLS